MRARLAILIAGALALAGCAARDRANPFDPANGSTSGRPTGFVALASDQTVELEWNRAQGEGLLGYQLMRRLAGQPEYSELTGVLPLTTTHYVDRGLLNGVDHEYALFFIFSSGAGAQPARDVATPGHAAPWMADAGTGALARLTPDNRHVIASRSGGISLSAVTVDSISSRVWASDVGDGYVLTWDVLTGAALTVPGFSTPGELAAQPWDSTAWVCDESAGKLVHLDASGRRLASWPFQTPTGVALDPNDASVWVCERDGDRVHHLDAAGAPIGICSFSRPSRVAVDVSTGLAWVTSYTNHRVMAVSPDGSIVHTVTTIAGPVGIAVDARRGRVWVGDVDGDRVVALHLDGSVEFSVTGLPAPRSVAVDPESGEAWAALAASGEVVRISPAGAILRRQGGFSAPYGIAIDP
jgi:DNA-binding beta-propeller fold protein YncE